MRIRLSDLRRIIREEVEQMQLPPMHPKTALAGRKGAMAASASEEASGPVPAMREKPKPQSQKTLDKEEFEEILTSKLAKKMNKDENDPTVIAARDRGMTMYGPNLTAKSVDLYVNNLAEMYRRRL